MAVVSIPYQPYLTSEGAMEIFRRGFSGKYRVYKTHFFINRDFVIKKSLFTGVMVKLKQEPGETSLVFTYGLPAPLLALACSLIIGWLVLFVILRPGQKEMEDEVQSFVENAPEFWGAPPVVAGAFASTAQIRQSALCASCSAPLSESARFCQTCGASVPAVEQQRRPSCSTCGTALAEDWRFCQGCGAAVPVYSDDVAVKRSQICCAGCGTIMPASSSFCHNCGMKIGLVAEENVDSCQQARRVSLRKEGYL